MSSRPARATGAHVSTCAYCGEHFGKPKNNYLTRDAAKRAMRRDGMVRGGGLHAYRCPSGSGYWHIGHRQAKHLRGDNDNPNAVGAAQIRAMAQAMHLAT